MLSIDTVKQAALRLSEFIGLKHKIRIKQSTALEAIARMEGYNSWNDYAAELKACSNTKAFSSKSNQYSLVGCSTKDPVTISGFEFVRHILAVGDSIQQNAWLMWQLQEHLLNEHRGCFIDVLDFNDFDIEDLDKTDILSAFDFIDFKRHSGTDIIAKLNTSTKPILVNPAGLDEYTIIQSCLQTYIESRKSSKDIFSVAISGYDSGNFNMSLISRLIRQSRSYNVAMLCTTSDAHANDVVHTNSLRTIYLDTKTDRAKAVLDKYVCDASCFIDTGKTLEIY